MNMTDTDSDKPTPKNRLLSEKLNVINIGLEQFSTGLQQMDVPVVHLDWKPPAGGNIRLATLLSKLED